MQRHRPHLTIVIALVACARRTGHESSGDLGSSSAARSASPSALVPVAIEASPEDTADDGVDGSLRSAATFGPLLTLGIEANLDEGTTYAVAGTALRVRVHHLQRANNINGKGGHVWSGHLSVCERAQCTVLGLGGPGDDPVTWHGYRFELLFAWPNNVRITPSPR